MRVSSLNASSSSSVLSFAMVAVPFVSYTRRGRCVLGIGGSALGGLGCGIGCGVGGSRLGGVACGLLGGVRDGRLGGVGSRLGGVRGSRLGGVRRRSGADAPRPPASMRRASMVRAACDSGAAKR